jgi:energy-coupling factor transporter transmembrane protein EcfT
MNNLSIRTKIVISINLLFALLYLLSVFEFISTNFLFELGFWITVLLWIFSMYIDGKRIRNQINMGKSLILLLLLSVTNSFSQDVYKTLLEGTYWGQPFELRQVTLSSEDGCNQFSHSQVLWYFKNENEPEKMDIGILTFNQLEDWKTFILMISGVADLKEVGYSKTNIVYKNFVAFINETQPLFISIITNPENKLALIRKNFFSEEETKERYLDKIGQLWQNDKCEGGILID